MNYYKRHLGDYAKDTKHLSLAEHGAFCLLLDYYYATEKPIPDDRCERIANAYAESERQAVRSVLEQFFVLASDGWRNQRADDEISETQGKSLKAKEAAEKRWCERNANAYANASKTHSDSKCERNASHKPLTNSHKKAKEGPADADLFAGIDPQVVEDFKALRKAKKAAITETALEGIKREAEKAGYTLERALRTCCERGWVGFKADWVKGADGSQPVRTSVPGGGRRAL